jgi:DNA invertase Pin-like site-specific DNA recombinase
LNKVIELLREGDVLYVWKLDRIVGSIIQLDKVLKRLEEKDASLRIITQPFIDTSKENPFSKFVRNMFALLSEFERDTIIERTKAGLASAKQRGKILGAPRGISDKNKKKGKLVAAYFKEGKLSVNEVCDLVGVSRGTYYKYLEIEGLKGAVRSYKKN